MMIKYTLCLLIPFISISLFAQEMAITLSNDTVYLYDNGTWAYDSDSSPSEEAIDFLTAYEVMDSTNTVMNFSNENIKEFSKPGEGYNLNVNTNDWKRVPNATINEEADYCFTTKHDSECFAMIIHEDPELETKALFNIAMENAKNAIGSAPKIISSDHVIVNGVNMIKAVYQVNVSGLDLTLVSLYHSGEFGSAQYTSWTYSNMVDKNIEKLEALLSGLVIGN